MKNYHIDLNDTAIIITLNAEETVDKAVKIAHQVAENNLWDDTDVRVKPVSADEAEFESMLLARFDGNGRQLA